MRRVGKIQATLFVVVMMGSSLLQQNTASAATVTTNWKSVFRMNVGGGEITDSIGRKWAAETGAIGGKNHTVSTHIAGTNDQSLFQSQRFGASGFNIPITNGTYRLQLLFAEIDPSTGARKMTIQANNKTLFKNLGITASVGTFHALVKRATVNVTGGTLKLRMSAAKNVTALAGIELLKQTTPVIPLEGSKIPLSGNHPRLNPDKSVSSSGRKWTLVARDNFNGDGVNLGVWNYYTGVGNEGVGIREPGHVHESGGDLNVVGSDGVSGGIAMKRNQLYGRWEIRAREDPGTGYGPAILLWPESDVWPRDGEVDIAEVPDGNRTRALFTTHWSTANHQKQFAAVGDFSQWHTWTVEWMPTYLSVWIDGVLVGTITDQSEIPHVRMHLGLQNDVGAAGHWIPAPNASTPPKVSLHVDYIKMYQTYQKG